MTKTLIYGYGNPGREDDGLGIEFADRMQEWSRRMGLGQYHFDCNYQLNIEDAHEISQYDLVLFADASTEPIEEFLVSGVEPSDQVNFSMHAVSPSYIFYLCREIFGKVPNAFLLHIKGYHWSMKEGLSVAARHNLDKAVAFAQSAVLGEKGLEQNLKDAARGIGVAQ